MVGNTVDCTKDFGNTSSDRWLGFSAFSLCAYSAVKYFWKESAIVNMRFVGISDVCYESKGNGPFTMHKFGASPAPHPYDVTAIIPAHESNHWLAIFSQLLCVLNHHLYDTFKLA